MPVPPAVSVRTGGRPVWFGLHLVLAALAAAALAAWAAGHAGGSAEVSAAIAGLAAALAALVTYRGWRLAAVEGCELRFDGQTWTLDGAAGQADVAIDLQRWLLLRWTPSGSDATSALTSSGPRWIAVSAADAAGALHGLRVALYAARPGAAPVASAAAAAPPR